MYGSSSNNNNNNEMLEGPTTAPAVAAVPKEETLYESLLRYHSENKEDNHGVGGSSSNLDTSSGLLGSSDLKKDHSYSVATDDDRKLPARPITASSILSEDSASHPELNNTMVQYRAPLSRPYIPPVLPNEIPSRTTGTDSTFNGENIVGQANAGRATDSNFDGVIGNGYGAGTSGGASPKPKPRESSSFYASAMEAAKLVSGDTPKALEALQHQNTAENEYLGQPIVVHPSRDPGRRPAVPHADHNAPATTHGTVRRSIPLTANHGESLHPNDTTTRSMRPEPEVLVDSLPLPLRQNWPSVRPGEPLAPGLEKSSFHDERGGGRPSPPSGRRGPVSPPLSKGRTSPPPTRMQTSQPPSRGRVSHPTMKGRASPPPPAPSHSPQMRRAYPVQPNATMPPPQPKQNAPPPNAPPLWDGVSTTRRNIPPAQETTRQEIVRPTAVSPRTMAKKLHPMKDPQPQHYVLANHRGGNRLARQQPQQYPGNVAPLSTQQAPSSHEQNWRVPRQQPVQNDTALVKRQMPPSREVGLRIPQQHQQYVENGNALTTIPPSHVQSGWAPKQQQNFGNDNALTTRQQMPSTHGEGWRMSQKQHQQYVENGNQLTKAQIPAPSFEESRRMPQQQHLQYVENGNALTTPQIPSSHVDNWRMPQQQQQQQVEAEALLASQMHPSREDSWRAMSQPYCHEDTARDVLIAEQLAGRDGALLRNNVLSRKLSAHCVWKDNMLAHQLAEEEGEAYKDSILAREMAREVDTDAGLRDALLAMRMLEEDRKEQEEASLRLAQQLAQENGTLQQQQELLERTRTQCQEQTGQQSTQQQQQRRSRRSLFQRRTVPTEVGCNRVSFRHPVATPDAPSQQQLPNNAVQARPQARPQPGGAGTGSNNASTGTGSGNVGTGTGSNNASAGAGGNNASAGAGSNNAGRSGNTGGNRFESILSDNGFDAASQERIWRQIQEERERKDMEIAEALSQVHLRGPSVNSQQEAPPQAPLDFMLCQQVALDEWATGIERPPAPMALRRQSSLDSSNVPRQTSLVRSTALDDAVPRISPREDVLRRGQEETQHAVARGQSHIVECHGCHRRLHAPISFPLVYCPHCHTVSPGTTTSHLQ